MYDGQTDGAAAPYTESSAASPANWEQRFALAHVSAHVAGGDPDAKRLQTPPPAQSAWSLPGSWLGHALARLRSYSIRIQRND